MLFITDCFLSRYDGTVMALKKSGENSTVRVRVKFDKHPDDKFDKWCVTFIIFYDDFTRKMMVVSFFAS